MCQKNKKMFMMSYPNNKKMKKWNKKNEEEQWKIAEKNDWNWCFLWGDIANSLRYDYEQVDKDPQVKDKYGGYDGWNKEPKKGEEYAPCTNKNCPYYDTITWGEHKYKGANCSYWGDTDRMFECHDELFALIQKWIDICGIEALDQLKEEWNIHPDIIGWFKEGNDYFNKKEDEKMYMNKEAVEEITNLLYEVQEVVEFVRNIGITYSSDPWTATSPNNHDYLNILTWDRQHFENIDISDIDYFDFGGSVCIAQYDYKGKYISGPKELHQAKVNTVKKYMQEVVDNFEAKYFEISNVGDEDIYDNCGWECFVSFAVTPIKPKCCIQDNTDKLIEQIANEDLRTAEDPWIDYNIKNPDDNKRYYAMVGFHSCKLINPDEKEYKTDFGPNRKYIQDASELIRKIENEAEELRIKYTNKNVKVSIGDFNVGCQYGMSIYVWIPYQKQPVKEIPKNLYYY